MEGRGGAPTVARGVVHHELADRGDSDGAGLGATTSKRGAHEVACANTHLKMCLLRMTSTPQIVLRTGVSIGQAEHRHGREDRHHLQVVLLRRTSVSAHEISAISASENVPQ